jgi:hypothetical protein
MSKSKKSTVDVQGTTISIVRTGNDDYISLTDIVKGEAWRGGLGSGDKRSGK